MPAESEATPMPRKEQEPKINSAPVEKSLAGTTAEVPKKESLVQRMLREGRPLAGGAPWLYSRPEELRAIRSDSLRSLVELAEATASDSLETLREFRREIIGLTRDRKTTPAEATSFLIKIDARIQQLQARSLVPPSTLRVEEVGELPVEAGTIFSQRWTRKFGIPDSIAANPSAGITRSFIPAEIFSEIAETGVSDQPSWYRSSLAIEASTDLRFRVAARNGFLRLIALDHAMRASRIDSVGKVLEGENKLTPRGIFQWLSVDQETRRALTLIFRLQGYDVADDIGADGVQVHDEIPELARVSENGTGGVLTTVGIEFSDTRRLEQYHIDAYLRTIQQAVGTDYGVMRLAYTIFRVLGFPHGNNKFAKELIEKHVVKTEEEIQRRIEEIRASRLSPEQKNERIRGLREGRDLEKSDVCPFVDKLRDARTGKVLKGVLETDGVVGMGKALANIEAEKLAREWNDLQLILDTADTVGDIRAAKGKYSSLPLNKRHPEILKEMGAIMAKRRLSEAAIARMQDSGRIEVVREVHPKEMDLVKQDIRETWRDITSPFRRKS